MNVQIGLVAGQVTCNPIGNFTRAAARDHASNRLEIFTVH